MSLFERIKHDLIVLLWYLDGDMIFNWMRIKVYITTSLRTARIVHSVCYINGETRNKTSVLTLVLRAENKTALIHVKSSLKIIFDLPSFSSRTALAAYRFINVDFHPMLA